MDIELIFRILFTVCAAAVLTGASLKPFHILQLSGYRARGVFVWLKKTAFDYLGRYFAAAFLSFIITFVYLGCFGLFEPVYYLGAGFFFLFGALFIFFAGRSEKKNKTPLVVTKRVVRLAVVTALVNAGVVVALLYLGEVIPIVDYALASFAFFLIPLTAVAAHFIVLPIEKLIVRSIKNRAKKQLAENPDLIKIGITGSFGKTTAKNILASMLSRKYTVCATPASYNTPMGIAKTVFGSDFSAQTQVFIAEMGARRRGDIAELCDMVAPKYGILTGIGNQHLESFGTLDAIKDTKFELIESLPADGKAFFGGDSPESRALYDRYSGSKEIAGDAVLYSGYQIKNNASEFILTASGESVTVKTVLLGKHIPPLFALCAAVALHLGLTLSEIAAAADTLKAVPHRLELIQGSGGTVVIDDAYNSNPAGAENALEVLSGFDGIRIVITPGMVELGDSERELNTEFGKKIARYADYAIFNSSRSEYLKEGAIAAGMTEDRIFVVASLSAATDKMKEIPGEQKVVLFENDLPDHLI